MRLLILSRYDRQGASSRVRFMQYQPYLEKAGFTVTFQSFFGADYLSALYSGNPPRMAVSRAYGRRFWDLLTICKNADLIWLEKEALPWVPGLIERGLLPSNIPIVTDFDDAVFHRYDRHRLAVVRRVLGQKYAAIIKRSACVFAGNAYLGSYAQDAGAPAIEIVPTVVNTDDYHVLPKETPDTPPTIGWIGTPSTWRECIGPFLSVLQETAQAMGSLIHAVGARPVAGEEAGVCFIPWTEASEIAQIQSMDIGIMPLPDTPWMRGKCGYKLIQYMACGLPVIASPVGVNADIVDHGVNGFLAETPEAWAEALKTLIADPDLRKRMGAAGRKCVEERYSLQVHGPRVVSMLRNIADTGHHVRKP